jgi:hypothetical protein
LQVDKYIKGDLSNVAKVPGVLPGSLIIFAGDASIIILLLEIFNTSFATFLNQGYQYCNFLKSS